MTEARKGHEPFSSRSHVVLTELSVYSRVLQCFEAKVGQESIPCHGHGLQNLEG